MPRTKNEVKTVRVFYHSIIVGFRFFDIDDKVIIEAGEVLNSSTGYCFVWLILSPFYN